MKKIAIVLALLMVHVFVFAEGSWINNDESNIKFFLEPELGAGKVISHTIRLGEEGSASEFDFVNEGGQELLFKFERYNLGAVLFKQHRISFLYQPLKIETNSKFKEDRVIDGVNFSANTPMEITYSFPFYRLTYGYDFFSQDNLDLAVGGAVQLRNASIVFKEVGGTQMAVSQNFGVVPALHIYFRYQFDNGIYLLSDVTGIYASSAFLNGSSFSFEGTLLDASLRTGYALKNDVDIFINARFLGGSAAGTSKSPRTHWTDSRKTTTSNALATTTVSLGLTVR